MIRSLVLMLSLLGCGPPPPPKVAPPPLDVLEHVYLRGDGGGTEVGLSVDGVGACTDRMLARLKVPAEGLAPLRATFFLTADALADLPDARATLARIRAEGHGLALAVPAPEAADPAAFRRLLSAEAAALGEALRALGQTDPLPRFWRPVGARGLRSVGRSADADRPVVLWSLREGPHLATRLGPGDLISLRGGGAGCPAVESVAVLGPALAAQGLTAVPVGVLLRRHLDRHRPPRAVRYLGPGLPAACARPLGLPAEPDAGLERPRWGLVAAADAVSVRVLPLPGADRSTARLLTEPTARRLWALESQWAAMPGCLRQIATARILSPITDEGLEGRIRWRVMSAVGSGQRDPRATGAPGQPIMLPADADLVRLEARQRLPWRLRGIVADALLRLGLPTPLLVEVRAAPAVVVGAALTPGADDASVEAAIGAFVQVVEVSLGEYLYLARFNPSDARRLDRAARAADGFLRAGPMLVLRARGRPDGSRLGPDGAAFAIPPAQLLRRALATGDPLRAGDVVVAPAQPIRGAPDAEWGTEAGSARLSRRARLRRGLARSILIGSTTPAYLRPGAVQQVDGDLLGQQIIRVAAPPGVTVPSLDVAPFIHPVSPRGGR